MVRKSSTLLIIISLCISILLQAVWGNIFITWFAFPVNLALLIFLLGTGYVLHHEHKDHPMVKDWASTRNSIQLIVLTFVGCLFIAFKPQWEIQQSWPFNVLLLLLLSNLLLATLRYKGPWKRRFWLNHAGLFIFISSMTFGAPDMHRWKAILTSGDTIEQAIDNRGIPHSLGYSLKLETLDAQFYDNGTPLSYHAQVSVNNKPHDILVNYPWHKSWKEDLYITNYGVIQETRRPYCIIEIIIHPWKYMTYLGLLLTACGAILLLWGKKSKNKGL